MIYQLLGGAAAVLAALASGYFYGKSDGRKVERLQWETANVETLVESNTGLSVEMNRLNKEIAKLEQNEVDFNKDLRKQETKIIERIVEIPIERIVKISDDCRIDYSLIGVQNSWASGNSIDQAGAKSTTSDLPLIGAYPLPRKAGEH